MTVKDILRELVSYPVYGGESNWELIHWIKDYIESFGVDTYLVPNHNQTKASLHCRIGPPENGGFILSGHTDVVPVEGQDWHTDPFELYDNGKGTLYGRGTCDMKGFVACCLTALPTLQNMPLKRPVYFAFSYDEEIGCLAAPELIDHMKSTYAEQPKYAIIGESSMMRPIIGQKGIYILDIYVNGSEGHSSRIKQEVSAVHEAAKLIAWIDQKLETIVNDHPKDERFSPPHSSLHVGQVKGGIAPNVIADQAWFTLDIRTIPSDSLDQIVSDFETYCRQREKALRKRFPGFEIRIEENHPPVPPLNTDQDAPIVEIISELTGNSEWNTVAYAAEAGQFAQAGYESIICGPGTIDAAHRADEYVSVEQLEACIAMIHKLGKKLSLTD